MRATAPASIGNFGPGIDIMGAAVRGPADSVVADWTDADGVVVLDAGHPDLPRGAERHASAIAAAEVLRLAALLGVRGRSTGLALTVRKGLPLAGGQGGSAASAVAGALATNALLGDVLDTHALLLACLTAEERLAGRHLDNLAPSLLGGIVLIRSLDPLDVVRLPVPQTLLIVLAHPEQRLRTADARAVLPRSVERGVALHQSAQVAAVVAALHTGDLALLGRTFDDRIAEPVRAGLLPGFTEAKRAALAAGALGCAISGAGPTSFAIVDDPESGSRVADAMGVAYRSRGIACDVRVAPIDERGAWVERAGAAGVPDAADATR